MKILIMLIVIAVCSFFIGKFSIKNKHQETYNPIEHFSVTELSEDIKDNRIIHRISFVIMEGKSIIYVDGKRKITPNNCTIEMWSREDMNNLFKLADAALSYSDEAEETMRRG